MMTDEFVLQHKIDVIYLYSERFMVQGDARGRSPPSSPLPLSPRPSSPQGKDEDIFQRALDAQLHNSRVSYGRFKIFLLLVVVGCIGSAASAVLHPAARGLFAYFVCGLLVCVSVLVPLLGIEHPSLFHAKMNEGLRYIHRRHNDDVENVK